MSAAYISGNAVIYNNAYYDGSNTKYIASSTASYYNQVSGSHIWATAASGTAGNTISFTQAMTLTAAGKLGIGVTSPSGLLDVRGAAPFMYIVDSAGANQAAFVAEATNTVVNVGSTYLGTAAVPLALVTGGTERARIDTAGRVLVNNTTLDAGYISVRQGTYYSLQSDTTSTSAGVGHVVFTVNGGTAGTITTSNTTTAYNTSSDCRLKENISVADDAGELIDSIEIVKHDWKAGGHTRYGAIAQDLHKVFPEAVAVGDADDVDELKTPWGVDYSKLVPMLVKEIQSLRARVAQLESK
jgi:hypothetical protein